MVRGVSMRIILSRRGNVWKWRGRLKVKKNGRFVVSEMGGDGNRVTVVRNMCRQAKQFLPCTFGMGGGLRLQDSTGFLYTTLIIPPCERSSPRTDR
jgi:hypothetical protein